MTKRRKILIVGGSLTLLLLPSLSTVGVTGADDLIVGKAAITQAIPITTDADRAMMASLDAQIAAVIQIQR